jgi:hypothetical protein
MSEAEPEETSEQEQHNMADRLRPSEAEMAELLRGLTTVRIHKLIRMADKIKEEESQTLKALKEVDPNFKGDFVNFQLKEVTYTDLVSEVPDIPEEFPFLEIQPVERVVQRHAEDLKAMNIVLTRVAKRLQLSIKYLLAALEAMDDHVDVVVSESLFCGLCLAGDAFSTLQVKRYTTPSTRRRIAVSTIDSQVPLVVQKARKDLFFRSRAGAKTAASLSPDSSEDDSDFDSDFAMRPKKRNAFNRKRFFPRQRKSRRRQRRVFEAPKYFQPKSRWKPTRRWELRAAGPPAPP